MKKKFFKQVLSMVLLVLISINSAGIVNATETEEGNATFALPQNEQESINTFVDTSPKNLTEDEINNLISTKSISEIGENELKQILEYSCIGEEKFNIVRQYDYSLEDAISIARILQNTEITIEQFIQMTEQFGDLFVAIAEGSQFGNFKYTNVSLGITDDAECISFLIDGNSANQILKAKAMSVFLNMPLSDTNNFYDEYIEYPDDDMLGHIANLFSTKRNALVMYAEDKEMTEGELCDKITETLGAVLINAGDSIETYGAGSSGFYNPATHPNAPFTYSFYDTEIINDMTGGVGYRNTYATLQGKNDLDLNIGGRYSTDEAEKSYITSLSSCIDGSVSKNDTTVVKQMLSPIGYFSPGWTMNFSYMDYAYYLFDDIYSNLILSDGSSRAIDRSTLLNSSCVEVNLYSGYIDLLDVRLFKDSSYVANGVTSSFCVKYKDGKKEYFDAEGKLMKTENRYGDAILFRYYTTGNEIEIFKQIYNKVEITDTLGQITTVEKMAQQTSYDEQGNERHLQPMVITLPDQSTITYNLVGVKHTNNVTNNDHTQLVESIVDQNGQVTSFEYVQNDVSEFSFTKPFDRSTRSLYPVLSITHPTGIKTEYTYEKNNGWLGKYDNSLEYYRITERKDTDGENVYNRRVYTYDGDYTESDDCYVSCTNEDGLTTEMMYVKEGNYISRYAVKEQERVYYTDNGEQIDVSKTVYKNYYERTYPQQIIKYLYNEDNSITQTLVENYQYDQYGDCIKYWSPYAAGNTTNTEYLTEYTYDTEYHYLTEKEYKKDASTTVKEVKTVSEDHKNVLSEITYLNNVLTSQVSYSYGENSGLPLSQTVARSTESGDSVTTYFEYDDNTFMTKSTLDGKSIEYTYNIYGDVLSQKDAKGFTTSYEYDILGRKTRTTYPNGTSVSLLYELFDTSGNLLNRTTETYQNGARVQYDFDILGRIEDVTDLTLNSTYETYEYDEMGRVSKLTLADNSYITYSYDVLGRKTSELIFEPNDTLTSEKYFEYTDVYNSTSSKLTEKSGSGENEIKTSSYTDLYGNVTRVDVGDTGSLVSSKHYAFDYVGNNTKELFKTSESGDSLVRYETTIAPNENNETILTYRDYYDNESTEYTNMSGQISRKTDANGNTIYYTYDASNRLSAKTMSIDGGTSVIQYTYDNNGNVVEESITDNKPGEATTVRNKYTLYDNMNRPVRTWGDEAGETRYTYDLLGNVATMTTGICEADPQGKTTTYQYDTRGRLVRETDAMGNSVNYVYDSRDNLIRVTDKNGNVTQNTYNAAGNIITSTVSNTTESDVIGYTYYSSGMLSTMTNDAGNISYVYNNKGQMTSENLTGVSPAQKSYTYDTDGNLSNVTINNGAEVYNQGYTYNYIGQLVGVRDNLQNKDVATYTYDGVGNVSTLATANGVTTTYEYNEINAISHLENKKGSNVLSSYDYAYNLDGNCNSVTENTGRIQSYTYDKLGRVLTETDSINGTSTQTSYAYDSYGNRVSKTVSGANASTTSYLYDNNNRMTKETINNNISITENSYAYDNNGNLISRSKQIIDSTEPAATDTYGYNLRSMLEETVTSTGIETDYTYLADGRRAQKTVNDATTKHIWNGDNIVYESGAQNATYTYGVGLISMTQGQDECYYNKNGHGDVVQMTNATGAVTDSYTYDAFGNQLTSTNADNPFRYCGEYYDTETGFIYLRNRYYNPSTGRFITEDPAKDGLNWYVYCGNNPIRYIDPTGYITEEEQNMYESGKMAPGAYTYLMLCTYYYYLQDDDAGRAYWNGRAQALRDSGYTNTGDWFYNWTIEQMPTRPNSYGGAIPLSQEEHYFRNGLNIEFTWEEFQVLQERLPSNLKWDGNVLADEHQNNLYNGLPNKKYVSADGHFEIIYNANNELQTHYNNWQDMGTYNYYSPIDKKTMHIYYDWLPYRQYGNVPPSERGAQ